MTNAITKIRRAIDLLNEAELELVDPDMTEALEQIGDHLHDMICEIEESEGE